MVQPVWVLVLIDSMTYTSAILSLKIENDVHEYGGSAIEPSDPRAIEDPVSSTLIFQMRAAADCSAVRLSPRYSSLLCDIGSASKHTMISPYDGNDSTPIVAWVTGDLRQSHSFLKHYFFNQHASVFL